MKNDRGIRLRLYPLMEEIMLTIKRAQIEDAVEITRIKTESFNKEINTYLGRDGGPPGYNKIESELEIIKNYIAYKIILDNKIIDAFFLYLEGDKIMHFEDFVIDPKLQGNGYGFKVLCMTEKMYSNIKEWKLSTTVF